MAGKKPYYSSNTLIEAVKRKMSFPISQVTFSDDDILEFANEEMFLEQVPSIMQYHEEYLVYKQEIPLLPSISVYPIPNRAIGMKVRDLFFKDTAGQLVEMSRINTDDRSFFQVNTNTAPVPIYYYVENNSIVIIPEVNQSATGTLIFTYYLRPNNLVVDEEAAVCQSFSKSITVDNVNLIAGDTLSIGSMTLIAGTTFTIGINSATTANNITAYINGLNLIGISAVAASNLVTLVYSNRNMTFSSSNSAGMLVQSTITINTTTVPDDIVAGGLIDILQTEAGHSTLAFDVLLAPNSVSPTSITLTEAQLPTNFVVGDYICDQYQCIIPQVPTDLHNLLAERTCSRILEALGDKDGQAAADKKIDRLEARQSTLIDNRVEGSPMKILNRSGLLRKNRINFGRRG